MARQTTVTLVDDLDGSTAVETVAFALDGKSYEIDLSQENAARLRGAVAPHVQAGRRASTQGGRRAAVTAVPRTRTTVEREQNQAIRDWARQRGMKVNDRGRIAAEVIEAFRKDHQR